MRATAATLYGLLWLDSTVAAPSYIADSGASRVEFTGTQAGAGFSGTFHQYSASVDFAPETLDQAHIDVQIQLASVDTKDKDRDKTITGPDVFDTAHFPIARYVARSVTRSGNGYAASGTLTLHGVTKDVPITFQFVSSNGSTKLIGTSELKRLDFGVGRGDWKSTEWIADPVKVSFTLLLNAKK
jgi:polyisoprenoid-binding protein YceI